MEEARAQVPFECLSRADLIDEESATLLRRAGCDAVWLGAESGSQDVLDAMDKGTKVGEIEEARVMLGRAGIKTGFFLQLGQNFHPTATPLSAAAGKTKTSSSPQRVSTW